MSQDHQSLLFFVAFFAMVGAGFFWSGSRAQHKNLFGAKAVEAAGEFSGLAVFRLHCGKDGPKVGVHFPYPGEADLRVVLDAGDALRLADLLEKSADGVE